MTSTLSREEGEEEEKAEGEEHHHLISPFIFWRSCVSNELLYYFANGIQSCSCVSNATRVGCGSFHCSSVGTAMLISYRVEYSPTSK